MRITVKLFASLGPYAPTGESAKPFSCDVEAGISLRMLIETLGVPLDDVRLKFVNGRARDLDYELQPGDDVGFFPPVGGG